MEERKNVWNHLDELRSVLFRSAVILFVATILCFLFTDLLLRVLLYPYQQLVREGFGALTTLSPSEAFVLSLQISLWGGLVVSFPLLFQQIWKFVAVGLYPKEKKVVLPALAVGTALFLAGSAFAFFLVVPKSLHFFWHYGIKLGVTAAWTMTHYIHFVLLFLFAFGLAFELPVIVVLANRFGLVSKTFLAEKRPYVIVGLFLVAGILTPPDVISQLSLAVPMWLLFELALWFTK